MKSFKEKQRIWKVLSSKSIKTFYQRNAPLLIGFLTMGAITIILISFRHALFSLLARTTHLTTYMTLSLSFCLILLFLLLLSQSKTLLASFQKLSMRTRVILLLILILGAVYRMFIVESIAVRPELGSFFIENALALSDFEHNMTSSKKAVGFPVILSVLFRFCDATLTNLYHFHTILGTLSFLLLFCFAYLSFANETIALIATSLFALSPLHIVQSGGSEPTLTAIFFSLLTFSLLLMFVRKGQLIFLFMSMLSLILTIPIRHEYITVAILFFLGLLFLHRHQYHWSIYPIMLFFVIVLLPYYTWFTARYFGNVWIDKVDGNTTALVARAVQLTFGDLVHNIFIPFKRSDILAFNFILLEAGLILGFKKYRKDILSIFAYYLMFFSAISFGHPNEGLEQTFKYYLSLVPPMCVLAAMGIYQIIVLFDSRLLKVGTVAILMSFFLPQFWGGVEAARYDNKTDTYVYKKHQELLVLQKHQAQINPDADFITSGPSIINTVLNFKKSQLMDIQNLEQLNHFDQKKDYYIYRGYFEKKKDRLESWHRVPFEKMIEKLKASYEIQEVFRFDIKSIRFRDHEIFLGKLNRKKPSTKPEGAGTLKPRGTILR